MTITQYVYIGIGALYLIAGIVCGLVAAWDLTLTRNRQPKPGLEIALGFVAFVVAVLWPFWLVGWLLLNRRYDRWPDIRKNLSRSMPRWVKIFRLAAGAGALVCIFFILWYRQYGLALP